MAVKLLIADDEDIIRNGIAKYVQLHTDRFEVLQADNGETTLEMIMRYHPEIILLDIQMPKKDGVEILKNMKNAAITSHVIILSGHDDFKYAQQAVRYGARDYLLKPVRSSDILSMLLEIADEVEGGKAEIEYDRESEGDRYKIVDIAKEYVKEHYFENLTLNNVADKVGITPGYLSTLFNRNEQGGFVDYLNCVRIETACIYLKQGYFKIYEIAYKVGFKDEKYFTKVFRKVMGMSPSEYRKSV